MSDRPAAFTPNVLDGRVNAIVQAGGAMIIGGQFSQVQAAGSTTTLTRNNILAFNATTGALSTTFVPSFDGEVTSLLLAPDGQSVYVGGSFNTVNGQASRSLARLTIATGQRVAGFTPPVMDGRVKDLKLAGGRLWVGGTFQNVAGVSRQSLATLSPGTGARDPYLNLPITGVHNGGANQLLKFDITPDGSRLVAVGNFTHVGGQPRRQIFMLDLTGPSAALAPWQTTFYTSTCASAFNTYMRDLDISPDGRYFVVTTTGAYRSPPSACDTHARFETGFPGAGAVPTWINYTGGDTSYAVAITGTAVYVGGHFRWANNPLAGDRPGPGAVSREGIAALDPSNGLPLRWNPGRTKGVGVFDLLATAQGLWVGSDTDRIGNFSYRARIAFLPLAGGTTIPPRGTGTLPGDVYQAGQLSGDLDQVRRRSFDGTAAGADATLPATGVAWSQARGAVMINGTVYYGWSDGNFYARTFNGTSFGAQTPVNTHDLLVSLASWHSDVPNITAMFYDDSYGRLYYTLAGQASLFYRAFTPESNVVGGLRTSVAGFDFTQAGGAFLAAGKLYVANRATGTLTRIDWVRGAPAGGAATVVGGPGWRARGMFLYAPAGGPPPPPPPPGDVSFVGAAGSNGNATSRQVTLPAGVAAGDGLLLFGTVAGATATMADPSGWKPVRTVQGNGVTTKLWQRVASAAEPGAVTVTLSALAKADVALLAYRGTAASGPVAAHAGIAETTATATHVTPPLTTVSPAWVVSYWADNSSATTAWTTPSGQTLRRTACGIGGGRICALATDLAVPAGTQGGVGATANSASGKATMWTVTLAD